MKRFNFGIACVLAICAFIGSCSSPSSGGKDPDPKNDPDPTPKTALTVAFDKNGGDTEADPTTITVAKKGAAVETLPKQPSRADYAFIGWNTKKDGSGSSFTAKTPVNESIAVYAQWHNTPPGMVTVGFDANGDGSFEYLDVSKDGTITQPADPTRTGYIFGGWYTDNGTFTKPFDFTVPVTGNITLFAKWIPINYTVAYDKNTTDTVTGNTPGSVHTYDEAKNLTANGFSRIGYVFAGWALTNTGPVKYADGQNVQNLTAIEGTTVTLYAKWSINTYTVEYNANGGSGKMDPTMFTVGGGGTLPMNSFTRPGYTFGGWSTTAGGTVEYTDGGGVTGLCSTPGETVILYAQWTYAGSFAPGSTGPGGGTIFYVDPSPGGFTVEGYGNPGDAGYFASYTAHYLEAAPSSWHIQRAPDDPHLAWAPTTSPAYLNPVPGLSVSPGTEDQAIGRGKKNTALILAYVSSSPATNAPAAYACNTYSSPNGTGGWFLPSLGELNQIYINGSSVGNLDTSYYYWSSSQFNNYYAWSQNFVNGYQVYGLKDIANVVRAIRAF